MAGGDMLARVSTVVRAVAKRPVVVVAAVVALLAVAGGVALLAVPSKPSNPSIPGAASGPTATDGPTTAPTGTGGPSAGPSMSGEPGSGSTPGSGSNSGAGSGSQAGTGATPGTGSGGVPDGFPILFDARQLGLYYFISQVTIGLPPQDPHVVRLLPGTYQLATGARNGITFSVSGSGTVGYDPGVAGLVSGAGTSTLTVVGASIGVNATALINDRYQVDESIVYDNNGPHTARVLPGDHQFITFFQQTTFSVSLGGAVSYGAAEARYLSGSGTNTLTVRGFPVSIDATAIAEHGYYLTNETTNRPAISPSSPKTAGFLPGRHRFESFNHFDFTVTGDGAVGYDAAQAGYLGGAGTATLTVRGFAITFDLTHVDTLGYGLGNAGPDTIYNDGPHTLRLLPGSEEFASTGVDFWITVGGDGTLSYDAAHLPYVTGAGTTTLTLTGVPITINATGSSQDFYLYGDTPVLSHTASHTLRLLPGEHDYQTSTDSWAFAFDVTPAGTVTLPSSQAGVSISGATVVVTGP